MMKKKVKKDAMLVFRTTDSMKAQIQEKADRQGISQSTYLRGAIISGLKTLKLTKEEKAILRNNPM